MAQLSESEINQIKNSISKFYNKSDRITQKLQNDLYKYKDSLRRAKSNLSIYSDNANKALEETEKAIDKVMNSSEGLFSNDGFYKYLEKEVNKYERDVENLFDKYKKSISSIIFRLPVLTSPSSISFLNSEDEEKYENSKNDTIVETQETICIDSKNDSFNEDKSIAIKEDDSLEVVEDNDTSNNIVNDSAISEYITDESLTILGIYAISDPNMKKITLSNVKEIYANAFKGSDNLELIVISNSIEKININAFRTLNKDCIIAFECDKTTAISLFRDDIALDGKKVIFDYKSGDENLDKYELYIKQESKKEKRIIIKKETPLDNNEIKELFISRNSKYQLTIQELNKGIEKAGTNIDKKKILYYASLERRINALNKGSYWDYANALGNALGIAKASDDLENVLSIIFGLLYLDSSGYRMVNGKYASVMQDPLTICYNPKMEFGVLTDLIVEHNLSEKYLVNIYIKSLFVKELTEKFEKPYYSLESSIQLMLIAIKVPGNYFYPAQSGIKRIN